MQRFRRRQFVRTDAPALRRAGLALAGLAWLAGPAGAETGNPPVCETNETSEISLRACTELLATGRLDNAHKARIYVQRAHAWLKDEEPAAAISDFTRAMAADPGNTAAIEGRANAFALQGQNDLSAADWSRLIAMSPSVDKGYAGRAAAKFAAGLTAQAISDYTTAIGLNPKNRDAIRGRAGVYAALNERDKAFADFAMILDHDPADFVTQFAKGQAAELWGDRKVAIESYKAVLKYHHYHQAARKALFRLSITSLD
jgi:tetratricopeptide (TPR) repeat protein